MLYFAYPVQALTIVHPFVSLEIPQGRWGILEQYVRYHSDASMSSKPSPEQLAATS